MDTAPDHRAHEARLSAIIRAHGIRAEHLVFEQSCHSVAEAALAAGVTPRDFVKTICLTSKRGPIVAMIVKGEDRANRQAAQQALDLGKLSIASPAEMLARTGFPAGGTPPFGFDAIFLVDARVLEMAVVYAGGGSEYALTRIEPSELVRVNAGRVGAWRVTAEATPPSESGQTS